MGAAKNAHKTSQNCGRKPKGGKNLTSTIEYLALGAVAIVLVISAVQAVQLSSLNEKVAQQNIALASLGPGGASAGTSANQGATVSQGSAPSQAASPSQQMVGGC